MSDSGLLLNSVLDKNDKRTEHRCRVFEGKLGHRVTWMGAMLSYG